MSTARAGSSAGRSSRDSARTTPSWRTWMATGTSTSRTRSSPPPRGTGSAAGSTPISWRTGARDGDDAPLAAIAAGAMIHASPQPSMSMIPRPKLTSAATLVLLACAAPRATAQTPGAPAASPGEAVTLMDGKSLSGWKPAEDPRMELLRDGSLASQRGKGVLYYAERPFKDFTLELEFLPEWAGAAAGIFLRLPQAPASLEAAERSAYEVKLGEDTPPAFREPVHYTRSPFLTGGINLVGADSVHHRDQMSPRRPVSRAPGEWNTLRVDAIGQRYTVWGTAGKWTASSAARRRAGTSASGTPRPATRWPFR